MDMGPDDEPEVDERILDTTTDDGEMAVLVKQPVGPAPDGGEWPVVLMFHDGPGIRSATHVFMRRLANAGYRVVTPDLYHRHGRLLGVEPEMRDTDPDVGRAMRTWLTSLTDDGIQHDADRALVAAGVDPSTPIATIGFCLGARAVFRRIMSEPDRVVAGATWHPSFLVDDGEDSPHRTASEIPVPLYLAIGEADEVQSIAMHRDFLDAVEPVDDVTVETFEGADHGFTWPDHPTYDEAAATRAWEVTTDLFARSFADA
ncbi:dienelactone hydrolase family protein [Ilumatobacter sp.]|uniref:dienelactone hydrolase family protein n=1 Tax=Ilumatobacter sp. TaxID=1967498 RepID=UPI003B51BBEF